MPYTNPAMLESMNVIADISIPESEMLAVGVMMRNSPVALVNPYVPATSRIPEWALDMNREAGWSRYRCASSPQMAVDIDALMERVGDEHVCGSCNVLMEHAPIIANDGRAFCSETCAHDEGYWECDECGEWSDDVIDTGYENFCSTDCAHDHGFEQCERCEEWFDADSSDAVHVDDYMYCSDHCAERDGYVMCNRCGAWVSDDSTSEVSCRGEWETWCDECCEDAGRCDGCGDLFYGDDLTYRNGALYCDDCMPKEVEGLHDYGYRPMTVFHGDGPLYLGIEIETDTQNGDADDQREYVEALMGIEGFGDESMFYNTRDSSLNASGDENGVEITSQPMSLDFHVGIENVYKDIRDTAIDHGYRAYDVGTCGQHIHASKVFLGVPGTEVEMLRELSIQTLVERFEGQLKEFSNRNGHYGYCKFSKVVSGNNKYQRPPEGYIAKARWHDRHKMGHGYAVNFNPCRNTIEFRFPRGTLNLSTMYANLAFVDGFMRTVKKHTCNWADTVDWYTFINELCDNVSNATAREHLVMFLEKHGLR